MQQPNPHVRNQDRNIVVMPGCGFVFHENKIQRQILPGIACHFDVTKFNKMFSCTITPSVTQRQRHCMQKAFHQRDLRICNP